MGCEDKECTSGEFEGVANHRSWLGHFRLSIRDERRGEVVAVDVVQVVVCVLVVRQQVLRDPHEDVEANRVRRELRPKVHPRVGVQVAVRGLVDGVGDEDPVDEGQQQAGERRALRPPGPAA